MKKNVFDQNAVIASAKNGELTGPKLRKAIARAKDMGLQTTAKELEQYLIDCEAFGGDSAPESVRERTAKGISILMAMGHSLTRTRQMFKKRGVIETINRLASKEGDSENFKTLVAHGRTDLTAEAIVLDNPSLFDPKAVANARTKLPNW